MQLVGAAVKGVRERVRHRHDYVVALCEQTQVTVLPVSWIHELMKGPPSLRRPVLMEQRRLPLLPPKLFVDA